MMEELHNIDEAQDIQILIRDGSDEDVMQFLRIVHPADLADLIEELEEDERRRVFSLIPERMAADVLPEIEDHYFEEVLESVPHERLAEFVDEMDTDDAADLLAELPRYQRRSILAKIKPSDSEELRELMAYGPETAGGLMQTEMIAVVEDATIEETIEEIRAQREEVEKVHFVFVVDKDKKLKGILDLPDLLLAAPDSTVSEIMAPEVISCPVDMDQEEVAVTFKKYDLVSLPVTDYDGRLVGRILVDDVIDAIEEEVDEDFLLFAGAGEEELEDLSIVKSVQARLPWLAATWTGGICTAIIMGHFAAHMSGKNLAAVAAFIPIVMAMGGNVGTQSATIVVRGIATGRIDYRKVGGFLLSQIGVGVLLGAILGTATSIFVHYKNGAINLSFIIGTAMITVISIAALLGTFLPVLFKRLGVDPAVATAPIIATCCDITGIVIYFSLAVLFL